MSARIGGRLLLTLQICGSIRRLQIFGGLKKCCEGRKMATLCSKLNTLNSQEKIRSKDSNLLCNKAPVSNTEIRHIHDTSAWNDLQKALQKVAPKLEYFSVSKNLFTYSSYPSFVISEEVLCEMEHLRHLVLSGCSRNWTSRPSLLPSLTHLKIVELPSDCRPTGKQLVNTLRRMPVLYSLHLRDAFPAERGWDTDQIHIASLRDLYVESVPAEIETFLRYITFPPTATVTVQADPVGGQESSADHAAMAAVISSVSQSYSNPTSSTTFLTLICEPFSHAKLYHGIRFGLFKDPMTDEQITVRFGPTADVNLKLCFQDYTHAPPHRFMENLMTHICSSALLLQDVVMHLDLSELDGRLSLQTLVSVFGILPQVRSVIVGRYSSVLFFDALDLSLYNQEARSTDSVEKHYFPNVSSIFFRSMTFEKADIKSLTDYLIRRSESGVRVEKLTFSKYCDQLDKFDVHLSQIVDEIHWAGDKY